MLLELRQLSQSLNAANVTVGQRDDHLVAYSKAKPLFRVMIDDAGNVQTVAQLPKEAVSCLLKYRVSKGGSQESTPGFNVPPMYTASELETSTVEKEIADFAKRLKRPPKGETSDDRRAALDAIIRRSVTSWAPKSEPIRKSLTDAARNLECCLNGAEGVDAEAIGTLKRILQLSQRLTFEALHEQVEKFVREAIVAGTQGEGDGLFQLLFGKGGVVILETADTTAMPVNHESVWQAVNRILLAGRTGAQSVPRPDEPDSAGSVDAFGDPYVSSDEKMPSPKLPRLGEVKIRSHSSSHPCQSRYGLVEGASFPVRLDSRLPLASALSWLTQPDREGKTFRDISGSSGMFHKEGGKTKPRATLLLAYPEACPDEPPALADLFVGMSAEADFVSVAGLTVSQLEDLKARTQSAAVTVFVLYRRDKGRVKLLFSRQLSADRIGRAVREWREAAANIPPVFVRRFGNDGKPVWHRPDGVPFPSEVARCLNTLWTWDRDNLEPRRIAAFQFGSALTLFLDDGRQLSEIAGEALRIAISQWVELLLAMGQAATLDRDCKFSPNEQVLLPSILGLLLAKLGHQKEVYMKAMPYWLGRFLAIADKVHRNYCDRERDGKIPNGPLMGNAVMSACLENPQAGFAELAQRIPPYQRVAGVELSKEWAEIIQHIDADNLPPRLNDKEKAQLLLGYLARPDLVRIETPSTETIS